MQNTIVTDPKMLISQDCWNPHYSNRYWNEPRTIYLSQETRITRSKISGYDTVSGSHYVYDDRLRYGDYSKHEQVWDSLKAEGFTYRTAEFVQEYIRRMMNKPDLMLVHILAGVNLSTGYSYHAYGYIEVKHG